MRSWSGIHKCSDIATVSNRKKKRCSAVAKREDGCAMIVGFQGRQAVTTRAADVMGQSRYASIGCASRCRER